MNKTKIDWCDYTWAPVIGCLRGCKYCYAAKIAKRFGNDEKPLGWEPGFNIELLKKYGNPYPYGFLPTFHRYRLDEPQKVKKSQRIFVVSMGDLFGDWVPNEWIQEVFKACEAAPQHKYLFLTKNPKRYLNLYNKKIFPYKENFWFGTTITKPSDEYVWFERTPYKTFISMEPLLEGFGELEKGTMPNWVIIGQQTNPNRPPMPEWVESIINQCRAVGVPVFVKNPLYKQFPIQEWPEGLEVKS